MTMQAQRVLKEAFHLPPAERTERVEQILSRFDSPARDKIDALWANEAEERIDAYGQGEIKSIPASQMFERITDHQS